MTYEQIYADWRYLWDIDAAYDMTGGYEEGQDLARLLANPNKKTAKECLENQIRYWFQVGPDSSTNATASRQRRDELLESDRRVRTIAEKYQVEIIYVKPRTGEFLGRRRFMEG